MRPIPLVWTVAPIRRLLVPLWLARVRLTKRSGHVALVGVGIGAAAAMLAAVLGGSLIAEDRSVEQALARVPPEARAIHVAYFGVPPQSGAYGPSLDLPVRRALAPLTAEEPIRVMQYGETRIAGALVTLAAIEGVGKWVELRSRRLPRSCSPSRCEVVQLGGSGPIPSVPGIRLVRVGRGGLTSPVPFGRLAPPGTGGYGVYFSLRKQPPFLVAEGVSGLSGLPELESIYRGYVWVVPLERESIRPWEVEGFAARVARARSALDAESVLFDLTAPVDELRAAKEESRIAGRRLLLIGGEAAALLLAFAVLAAAGMRRDFEATRQRLTWLGVGRWQLVLLSIAEVGAVAATGAASGWGLGIGASALLADGAGSPVGPILRHSVVSVRGLTIAAGLAGVAALVLLVSLGARAVRLGGLSLSVIDVAALGALAAVALILVRGDADPQALTREGGTGVVLLVLPGLVTFVAAVVCARVLAPALRLLERLSRRTTVPVRLAVLSLARHPAHAAIAVTFLAASLGLALFAGSYRSTLARGQSDQADFAFPADFILREDLAPTKLVAPLQAAPLSRYRSLGADVRALPVIRRRGSVSRLAGAREATLLGVPAAAFPTLRGWREDFAPIPVAEIARRLEPPAPLELRGARIPEDGRELLLRLDLRGQSIAVDASILTRRGDFVQVDFGETAGQGSHILRAPLPGQARGGQVVALTFSLPLASRESREARKGLLTLRRLEASRADGQRTPISDYRDWVGVDGIEATRTCCGTMLRYFVSGQAYPRFRPRQPTDGRTVPIVASPRLAAAAGPGGILPFRLAGGQLLGRVVATAKRFPGVYGEFVLADEASLFSALNTDQPGSAVPNEIWVSTSSARAVELEDALRKPPFDVLELRSRRDLEHELRSDPLARGALVAFAASAAVALALALVGLVLGVVADLRDERGELFDLEAQGAAPATLRLHLRLRAAFAALLGLLGGLGLGAVLTTLVVDLVALTANAAAPEPPLVLDLDWRAVGVAVGGYVALALVLVAGITWGAFRSATPSRSAGVGA